MLITSLLIFKILLNNSLAEWVDMPQFSNEKKIYRIPTTKQDHFYKFAQRNMGNQFSYIYQNITYKSAEIEQISVNETEEYNFHSMKKNIKEDQENMFVPDTKECNETIPLIIKEEKGSKQCLNESFTSNNVRLLDYLPVDILKSVHYTLKSQPASIDGKIHFLKTFENTLMTEIEFQLAESITNARKRRGTEHYDHSYDHEHAAGFPSIEGALMAISFLTFAVYLIRLVMLLFRNMNNSTPTPTTTLFLGRRKKSIDKFNDDASIILKNLHNFSSKF
ncbi:hypothetical protein K0M31_020194 [Melipona bicolor]|uniref:Uncharacterized protein n=1 Tax=Melipona bicolor TaxID=60889 RepID=A0AA40G227_9HYME|nr:hypothetical protein K0M31_020194 [Melipona bicolor]